MRTTLPKAQELAIEAAITAMNTYYYPPITAVPDPSPEKPHICEFFLYRGLNKVVWACKTCPKEKEIPWYEVGKYVREAETRDKE